MNKTIRRALAAFRLMPESEHVGVKEEAVRLRLENGSLREQVDRLKAFKNDRQFVIDAFVGSPEPSGEAEKSKRRDYMGRVAGFHADILAPKLREMISTTLRMFEDEDVVDSKQHLVKGALFAFREMMLWGDNCTTEHVSVSADEAANKPNSSTI